MKRKISLITLISIAAFLSYQIQSFEFILLALILLSLIFLILAAVRNYFKSIPYGYFKVPVLIIIICIAGVIASLFRPYEKVLLESGSVSEKLAYAYSTDQNDRKQLRSYIKVLSEIKERDTKRLAQVNRFYEKNEIIEPIDKFYAAFVYHHSDKSMYYKIASHLARDAARDNGLKDNYQVQWLAKASYDRYMLSIGKEEKYNTQNKMSIDLE
ncbi:MAG: hypothetical protein ABJ092_13210 [Gillisia sp.]